MKLRRSLTLPLFQTPTSESHIVSAEQKRHLDQIYDTQVVDMERFSALEVLTRAGLAVAIVPVISDKSHA